MRASRERETLKREMGRGKGMEGGYIVETCVARETMRPCFIEPTPTNPDQSNPPTTTPLTLVNVISFTFKIKNKKIGVYFFFYHND